MDKLPPTSFRHLRTHLKAHIESTSPLLIGNWHTTRAILIPIKKHYRWDKAARRKARAQAKNHFASAINQAFEN